MIDLLLGCGEYSLHFDQLFWLDMLYNGSCRHAEANLTAVETVVICYMNTNTSGMKLTNKKEIQRTASQGADLPSVIPCVVQSNHEER
jgi:hypothetical protein